MHRVTVELSGGDTQHITTNTPVESDWVAGRVRAGVNWEKSQIVVVLTEIDCPIHGWSYALGGEVCSECYDYRSM